VAPTRSRTLAERHIRTIVNTTTNAYQPEHTIPPRSRDDTVAEMIDERWVSPDLRVLISAHCSDSRWGEIDYHLTNIRRVEPPEELFVVPADYTIQYSGPPDDPWLGLGAPDAYIVAHPFSARRWERRH
jgi:hypothetical protein